MSGPATSPDGGRSATRVPLAYGEKAEAGATGSLPRQPVPFILVVLDRLSSQPPAMLWAVTAGSLGLIGALDYFTGAELASSLFYLFPVGVASWCLGTRNGRFVAVLSALTWQGSNLLAGEAFSSPWVAVWNTAIRLGFFLILASLLSEVRLLLEQRTALSRQDALTGVLNKRAFYEAADLELIKLRRYRRPLTIVFLDIDGFKSLNDTQGHLEGDKVLRRVALQMQQQLRGADVIGRMGGDEYAILLPDLDSTAAHKVMARLHGALTAEIGRFEWPVTVSMGVLTCTGDAPGVEEVVDRADRLMYVAKRRGGDCVEYDSLPGTSGISRSPKVQVAQHGKVLR
jgi:diguanylate cyclase (GGDEF)-like protein